MALSAQDCSAGPASVVLWAARAPAVLEAAWPAPCPTTGARRDPGLGMPAPAHDAPLPVSRALALMNKLKSLNGLPPTGKAHIS